MAEQLIYESTQSKVYYYPESKWGKPVLVKILHYEFPTPGNIEAFFNEYEILKNLNMKGVRGVIDRIRINNRHAIVLEWVDGESLEKAFQNKHNDLLDFFHIAIEIAKSVDEIHRKGIIHRDINPSNILVNLQKQVVHLIDFGISTQLSLKKYHLGNPNCLEGTLPYSSPEQTGRMNRVVDYRTDLYSMGATFYAMLTGHPPFQSKDAMELVHAHIALHPLRLHQVNPNVPEQVSHLVAKLLAKNAEDRYQSADGVKADLERCLQAYEKTGSVSLFTLAEHDYSGKFSLPETLFGREKELEAILDSFQRCARGEVLLTLISGYSGTGKSALVNEVHKPITTYRGYFISGKFDQFQRSVPYFAFIEAFKDLVNILLTEDEQNLAPILQDITTALGKEGKVITNVIPNLECLIGPQPDIPEVGGVESQNRFNYVFLKFVHALCTSAHPVVLFIDDLQWADTASLQLLRMLMTDPGGAYLLCITAYRDNEVSPTHPFIITVKEIRETGRPINEIAIGNLSPEHVNAMIATVVNQDSTETHALTELVYEKTHGNAFFVTQLLKSLYEEELLNFDTDLRHWHWNTQKIREKNISDNVVHLVAGKILRLSQPTQQAMKMAACLGASFDLDTLATICGTSLQELKKSLHQGVQENFLVPLSNDRLKFSHDRIQQAIYSLIPDPEKKKVHLNIGRILLHNIPADQQENRLFDIVAQLNSGWELLDNEEEQTILADLNLRTGRKAKENSAFQPAFDYLMQGINLLKPHPWETQYDLCLQLHVEATEAAYLIGNFADMNRLYRTILENVRTILEKVKPYEIRIMAYKAENKLMEAIQTGLEVLGQLGEHFPQKPNMAHVLKDLALTALALSGTSPKTLLNLPVMSNPYKIAAMRIIAAITSSVYWASPQLLPIVIFRMVRLSLNYGNHAASCYGYGGYGLILCALLGFMKQGYTYATLSLDLLEKLDAKEWKAQIYCAPYALTVHWNAHVKHTLGPLKESFHIGMETGQIEFACTNTNIYCIHIFLCGKPLQQVEEEAHAYSRSYHQLKQETIFNYNEVYRQAILNFMGKSANPLILVGDAYNEVSMMIQNQERNDQTGRFFIHFLKLMLGYHFGDYANAHNHGEAGETLFEAVLGKFEIPNLLFYQALNCLALYPGAKGRERDRWMAKAKKNLKKLQKWAQTATENFGHKAVLIEAEILRVRGDHNLARPFYDRAIKLAATHDFLHEEALAYELAGRFYLESEAQNLAEFYLKSAYNKYREWGAEAKLRLLEQTYPEYISRLLGSDETRSNTTIALNQSNPSNRRDVLDIATVIKAATTIAGEVVLSKLLSLLIQIVMENAGARRGLLALEKEGDLFIEAIHEVENGKTSVLSHQPLENSGLAAESVVQFVRRSREFVVIHDVVSDLRYSQDPYILSIQPKSILSLPIINQGKFIGILYLENDLATGAFAQERINLLTLLSGQIAISIDNALLYEQLEQKVAERTQELAEEKKKTDDLLLNILPAETAAELKLNGFTEAKYFESVSILFTDFKEFTSISEKLTPTELVKEIDQCFRAFDHITEKYGIEKIKTIGDAYMAAGGLPVASSTHPEQVVKAALEIRNFIDQRLALTNAGHGLSPVPFQIRIGIHTGPVVAGIVGTKKFQYDIWGDTVNTAARLESSGEIGKINISHSTYLLVKDKFQCSFRGEIEAKGKGKIKMYFLEEYPTQQNSGH